MRNNKANIAMSLAMMMGLAGIEGIYPSFQTSRGFEPKHPTPPKKVFTPEQEKILSEMALDKTPQGRKIYKKFKRACEKIA